MNKEYEKICPNGHTYYHSTDWPACPTCWRIHQAENKDLEFGTLSAPAQRALDTAGIKTLMDLTKWTKKDILKLHGMGPASIPKMQELLKKIDADFAEN